MDPNDIELETMAKMFAYEKESRMIDEIKNIEDLKNIAKSYIKLYLKQQEVVSFLGIK
jgi:hypothetical protein